MEPKIRLKGFIDSWNYSKLSEIARVQKGEQINKNSLSEMGTYYVLNGGQTPSGYTSTFNTSENTISISEGGNSCGYVAFNTSKFWSGGHNYTLQNVSIHNRYLYSYLKSIESHIMSKRVGSGLPNIQKSALLSIDVMYPSDSKEQEQIADYFKNLEALIDVTIKKIDSLKQVKAASLQFMFPQEGTTKPRIRLKEYTKDWCVCKLSSILLERHEVSTITLELPQLSFTIADGIIRPEDRKSNQRDFLIKDKDNKRYLITRVGDIIYNPANVVFGAIHRNSLTDGVVSPIYRIFHTDQDSRFIECVVRRPSFINQLAMRTEGTVTKLKTLKPEAFLDMTVCIPTDIEEQKAIGEYFRNLDLQIRLQNQRLEKLKQIKSACLDNMFV